MANIDFYRKAIPSEQIDVGDIIMLDPDTSLIKKAVYNNKEELLINSRLIIGVCISSDNTILNIETVNAGNSKVRKDDIILDGGNSLKVDTIMIDAGDSSIDKSKVIQVAYNGTQKVNVTGYVDLGDRLCISREAGKAKSKDFLDKEYFDSRSIGKVIKFTNRKDQVIALLDIE